jgi:hypothetical protein
MPLRAQPYLEKEGPISELSMKKTTLNRYNSKDPNRFPGIPDRAFA